MRIDHRVQAAPEVCPDEVHVPVGERHLDADLARILSDVRDEDAGAGVGRIGVKHGPQGLWVPAVVSHGPS